MKVYIVSDFHLAFNPKTEEELERNRLAAHFLTEIKGDADMLILAGDIFDLWYDWKQVIIKGYFPFLKKLADLDEAGCRLVFIAGNHDFWFGDFMKEYLNCQVFMKNFQTETDGKKLFVSHGDQLTANDIRYRLFHFALRNRFSRLLFSLLHPNTALSLGKLISRTSRARSAAKASISRKCGLQAYAEKIAGSYDIIVMGHSHNSGFREFGETVFINTGYWGEDCSYVLIEDGRPELKQFKLKPG